MTAEIVLDGGPAAFGRATVVRLGWHADDPLAVTVSVTTRPDHPALPRGRWVILRDFLRYGLDVPTGDGAVRIRPADEQMVLLELQAGSRPYAVRVPAEPLREFLDATERLVPAGTERSGPALDALIERLLDRSSE